jgi:hypothetical protein
VRTIIAARSPFQQPLDRLVIIIIRTLDRNPEHVEDPIRLHVGLAALEVEIDLFALQIRESLDVVVRQ